MVRIRFPPAKSQQQTRFRHLRHEGFRAKLKMPAGSSTGLNLPIQPYAAPPTCGRSLRPHPRHTSAHIHVERGRRERDGFLQSFLRLVDPTELADFRPERIAGWDLHPLESADLSRRTPEAVARAFPRHSAP